MSEWISVYDRLPDDYTPVICLAIEEFYPPHVTAGVRHETLGFCVFNMDGEPDTELREVTHWMPLPAPPE